MIYQADSVRCLIELGADLTQRDSNGYNALQVSALRVSRKNESFRSKFYPGE